ncbi:MAG: rRNA maturation RNase YbeY [Flavobacteriales bacterium]
MISLTLIDVKKPSFVKSLLLKSYLKDLVVTENLIPGDISIVLCSDEYLLKVNQDFLNHDYYTDIITFDYCEGKFVNGDLMISLDRVKDNALSENTLFSEEFYRVVFHGVLHLCGFKDKSPKDIKEMRMKESFYLSKYVSRETSAH